MCAHWYITKHFSELSCLFFSKSKGRILDELCISFKAIDIQWKKKFSFFFKYTFSCMEFLDKVKPKEIGIYIFNSLVAMAVVLFPPELVQIFETWYLKTHCEISFQIWTYQLGVSCYGFLPKQTCSD